MENTIWKQPVDLKFIEKIGQNTLQEHLGIEFTTFGPDWLEARMPVDQRTKQPAGLLHGGASVALAETLGSIAGTLCLDDLKQKMIVGIEINANHLRPATSGYVTGRVSPIRVGRTVQVWQIDIRNEKGDLTCVSRLTVGVVDRNK